MLRLASSSIRLSREAKNHQDNMNLIMTRIQRLSPRKLGLLCLADPSNQLTMLMMKMTMIKSLLTKTSLTLQSPQASEFAMVCTPCTSNQKKTRKVLPNVRSNLALVSPLTEMTCLREHLQLRQKRALSSLQTIVFVSLQTSNFAVLMFANPCSLPTTCDRILSAERLSLILTPTNLGTLILPLKQGRKH